MNRSDYVRQLLEGQSTQPQKSVGSAFAPSNIALCKYWGKRDAELNLPVNSSLSISLGDLGTHTEIAVLDGESDQISLNGQLLAADHNFSVRLANYLDLFRNDQNRSFSVKTTNSIPTAAGLASSASGFAALVKALSDLFGWTLTDRELTTLARLGSGSASRSLYQGFVQWHAGEKSDGSDSFAEALEFTWPNLRIGILEVATGPKATGSTAGMNRTTASSPLFAAWPETAANDLKVIKEALTAQDFQKLGETAEGNAIAMHATMMAARPALFYWTPDSLAKILQVQQLRANGLPVYFTMDAGPNLKLLFEKETEAEILKHFPTLQIIHPFAV